MLLKLGDSPQSVQQTVNRYRSGRYRDILPVRAEYWGWADLETMIAGLEHQWYTLAEDLPIVDQTLAQSNIRRNTGVTIMAIERGRKILRYPTGQVSLLAGDRLLAVGTSETLRVFEKAAIAPFNPPR
jgi:monovalent cation:H+ antiporter-2, CPA2 family